MWRGLTATTIFLFVFWLFAIEIALAEGRRVALVIGNSGYQNTGTLQNPKNDATDIAARLKELGFEVLLGVDLDKAHMDRAIRDFADALNGAESALFFYAGHGLQVGSDNYLVPVDAKLTTAAALDFEMVRLDLIQRTMEREARTNIIFLDACRDNPLARNLARAMGTRSAAIGKGLAKVESGEGTLISFSTQPGNVALDGSGRNSPYTEALLSHIVKPGDDLSDILINVRNDVMKATGRKQVPWENSALTAKFYFIFPPAPGPSADQQMELQFWGSVKDSTNPDVLRSYLVKYPNGSFAPLAQALIKQYEQQQAQRAAEEEAKRREEAARKGAGVKQLEDERKAREIAMAEERRKAEEAKNNAELLKLKERQRQEELKHAAELRKAQEELRAAREAATKAEERRLAAEKSTEAHRRTALAEQASANEKETAHKSEPSKTRTAVLNAPNVTAGFDGTWKITRVGPNCGRPVHTFTVYVSNGQVVTNSGNSGTISTSGSFEFTGKGFDGKPTSFSGTFQGNSGHGTFSHNAKCNGTFTATRN